MRRMISRGRCACGSISAPAFARLCAELHESWQRADVGSVREINQRLIPLHDALFAETSPAPVKYAASLLGRCTAEVRQPLWTLMPETQERVQRAMRSAGLLN